MIKMYAAPAAPTPAGGLRRWTEPMFQPSTYRSWGYLLAGLPLGVLWFSLLVPLYLTGAALVVIWIGLGWLALTQLLSRWIGRFEGWFARVAVGADIPRPARVEGETVMQRGRALLGDELGYRMLLWSAVRVVSGPIGFVLAILSFVVPVALTLAPVSYVWGAPPMSWAWTLWLAPLLGIPAFVGAAHLISALGRGGAWLGGMVLGPSTVFAAREASRRADRAEERLRIDQELHDSIGHVVTMNVVQAGAGAHVFDDDPEFAREALTNIERRGRDALAELDRIITLVRSERVDREPLPGLVEIDGLIMGIRDAGMEIEADLQSPEVPAEVGRAAYRIVQEALTNVAKHAAGAAARVTVIRRVGSLDVEVVNGPPGPPERWSESGTGSGLAGIHRRVAILGGQSEAGPTADGGFRVYATLPITGS
jgi:signal transduction histidine kinase